MLKSKLFSGNDRLKACETQDSAHVTEGETGPYVRLIQAALTAVDGAQIDAGETSASRYGKSTSAAVLSFKTRRQIINFSYEKTADPIVGKMTIVRLDAEVAELEQASDDQTFVAFVRPLSSIL